MAEQPYTLAEIEWKVFETTKKNKVWSFGDPYDGVEVNADRRRLDELVVSFYFVLPKLTRDAGIYNLLTVARGIPAEPPQSPRFWNPVRLADHLGGVYLYATYEPARSRFQVRMNVGNEASQLRGVILRHAPPDLVCGRLLQLHVEINEERLFASIHDPSLGDEVAFDDVAPSTGGLLEPWGASPSGYWWVVSGVGDDQDARSLEFPPGFGLSDLRVTFGSEVEYPANPLRYSGALDHLVDGPPPGADKGPDGEPPEGVTLGTHVEWLRLIADDLERISTRLPPGFQWVDSSGMAS